MTATLHIHHRPLSVTRAELRTGWPRKMAAALMILIGAAFIITTLVANLFRVGPAFDRMTDGFRPIMTQQAIQTDRADIAAVSAAGTEIQTKMLPALAQQLHMTPAQLSQMISTQYPDVAAGLQALPTITPSFTGLVNTLDQQRPLFQSADAIPTKDIPATTVPWTLLAVGIVTAGLGVFVWYRPRTSAVVATVLGAALIAAPLSLNMVHKASDADQMNRNLKPIYTQQLITQANGAITTLSSMGTQMQKSMLPALATQLHMTPAQFQAFLGENFPATAAALTGMPASIGRFQNLVATFDNNLSEYNTLKPVSFEPIVWFMIIGGSALFLLGAAGVVITWKKGDRAA